MSVVYTLKQGSLAFDRGREDPDDVARDAFQGGQKLPDGCLVEPVGFG